MAMRANATRSPPWKRSGSDDATAPSNGVAVDADAAAAAEEEEEDEAEEEEESDVGSPSIISAVRQPQSAHNCATEVGTSYTFNTVGVLSARADVAARADEDAADDEEEAEWSKTTESSDGNDSGAGTGRAGSGNFAATSVQNVL